MTFGIPKEFAEIAQSGRIKMAGVDLQLLNASGYPITPPMRIWLDQVVPILEKDAGGPYEHDIQLQDAHLWFERETAEDILVPVDNVKITYYVSEFNERIDIHADRVVKAILKDAESGEIEHFHR